MEGTLKVRSVRVEAATLGLLLLVAMITLMTARPAVADANVFTVDRGDDPDLVANPVVDNCTAAGANDCSLRGAIAKANRTANDAAGPDEIRFNIPGSGPHTISPTSPLPNITGAVTIDGYTQPGASVRTSTNNAVLKIELSGASAGFASGLTLDAGAGGSTVRGLVINRFGATGVVVLAENSVVEGNFVGVNPLGNADLGNGLNGVSVGASGNLIGGASIGARNVISGNNRSGVLIGRSASNARVEGNLVGTSANGSSAVGNGEGVHINSATGNTVGGTAVGAGNTISGNADHGILVDGGATGNNIQSNRIGTSVFVNDILENGLEGVRIAEGSNNVIGGTASRTGNIISGNNTQGVELDVGASDNRVQGNLIGTGQNGASDLGNSEGGVDVKGPDNTIGGTLASARNVISGNDASGVSIFGASANGNRVEGNLIGTDVGGTQDLGNLFDGIAIEVGSDNTISRNTISGNGSFGVELDDSADGNRVEGNRIGTRSDGTGDVGNRLSGVFVDEGSGNTIGGTVAAAANTISGNDDHGVIVLTGAGNRILRNSISDNGLLGINLAGGVETNGAVTENDKKDPDAGPNDLQNFPVLTSAATTTSGGAATIQGRLDSTPNATFTVQFFSNTAPNIPTLFGEGKTFVGETTVTTGAGGDASFAFTSGTAVPVGSLITATATNPAGSTSELSAAAEVRAPITVNSTGDAADANLNDSPNACDSDLGTAGLQCTLRAAIQEANSGFGGADTIHFAIPGGGVRTIAPASPLPTVTQPLTIDGYSQPGSSQNTLAAGTNAVVRVQLSGANAGTADGLNVEASGCVIRGLAINRFARGIRLDGSENTRIEGNFVGTNAAGTADLGNSQQGVVVVGGGNNAVGGIGRGARNVISGNGGSGLLFGSGSAGNGVEGNVIGANKDGVGEIANSGAGVFVNGASDTTIGGVIPAAANTTAFNGADGMAVDAAAGSTAATNRILRNRIFSNGALGIDLDNDGPTANDPRDRDAGPNDLQNKPAITSASRTTIRGSLNSTPNRTFTIQFFRNSSGDEGQVFVGQKIVKTNANGTVSFAFSPATALRDGQSVTATATGAGNTSEFSAPRTVAR